MSVKTIKSVNVNILLPKSMVNKIDYQRGDIPRSKFILRLLELAYKVREKTTRSLPVETGGDARRLGGGVD
jgi:hypothetical protein